MSRIFEALQRAQKSVKEGQKSAPADSEAALAAEALSEVVASAVQAANGTAPPLEPDSPAAPDAAGTPLPPAESSPDAAFPALAQAIVASDAASPAAEQYRMLRTRLLRLHDAQPWKAVLIASPGPGDGKTLTALNLAVVFGQKPSTRVLLIEADMRKPILSQLMGISQPTGLADFLAGEAQFEELLCPVAPSVFLMPAGCAGDVSTDLLHAPQMNELMAKAREQFDWIIMDGPPINLVADHELLAGHCDGVLLVVRPMHTSRQLLAQAMKPLEGRRILGVVLNATQLKGRYGPYYGYYGAQGSGKPRAYGYARSRATRAVKAPAGEAEAATAKGK